ncbi:MAG TPA: hypothetical protein VGX03_27205, partial [Candidatus Binatia bacterium]|nr:hypothetical protein [Candidatus Binatia bacterium]
MRIAVVSHTVKKGEGSCRFSLSVESGVKTKNFQEASSGQEKTFRGGRLLLEEYSLRDTPQEGSINPRLQA